MGCCGRDALGRDVRIRSDRASLPGLVLGGLAHSFCLESRLFSVSRSRLNLFPCWKERPGLSCPGSCAVRDEQGPNERRTVAILPKSGGFSVSFASAARAILWVRPLRRSEDLHGRAPEQIVLPPVDESQKTIPGAEDLRQMQSQPQHPGRFPLPADPPLWKMADGVVTSQDDHASRVPVDERRRKRSEIPGRQ